jgi:type IX secretion system PorP/SprF family membrane protein
MQPIFMKKDGLFCLALLWKMSLFAQDIHFSQWTPNPTLLNPAWTGNPEHTHQVATQYRNQWSPVLQSAAYRTFAASADGLWKFRNRHFWGLGVHLHQDQAGTADFTQTQGGISGLFRKYMGKTDAGRSQLYHYLTLGAGIGFRQYHVDESKLHWVKQFGTNGVFQPDLAAPIYLENNTKKVEEVNVGLLWHAKNQHQLGFEFGFSIFHLTTPNLSLVAGGKMPLARRYALHGSVQHPLKKETLQMKYYFTWLQQGATQQTVLGAQIFTRFEKQDMKLGTGLAFRQSNSWTGDALIGTLSLDFQTFIIGLNYDWNPIWSEQHRFNHAIEMSFLYKIKTK